MIPTKVYFNAACGSSPVGDKCAKDLASAAAGVSESNLEKESSVLAPGIKLIDRAEFDRLKKDGETVKAINGSCTSREPGATVCAAIACALPVDPSLTGFVAEVFETAGVQPEWARRRAMEQVIQIFARYRGLMLDSFDAREVWNENTTRYTVGGAEIDVQAWVAHTTVNRAGDDTCALVLAALLP